MIGCKRGWLGERSRHGASLDLLDEDQKPQHAYLAPICNVAGNCAGWRSTVAGVRLPYGAMARGESTRGASAPTAFGELLRQHRFAAGLRKKASPNGRPECARASRNWSVARLIRIATPPERLIRALHLARAGRGTLQARCPTSTTAVQPRVSATALGTTTRTNLPISRRRLSSPARTRSSESRSACGESRLLTITGSGGCGKTRLALEVAPQLESDFTDGVWLVELAPLADTSLVAQTIATTLGIRDEPGRPVLDVLTDTCAAATFCSSSTTASI